MRWRAVGLAGAVAVLVGLARLALPVAAASAEPSVRVSHTEVGQPIAPGFLGLSFEYWAVPTFIGSASDIDPVFVQLIRNITPGQRPVLRVGGDTTDWTWWPVPGMTAPAGVRYSLSGGWVAAMRAFQRVTSARFILGIDLEADSTRLASYEARQLVSGLGRGRIAALDIGNEPELYAVRGWWFTTFGAPVLGRSPGYGFNAFNAQFAQFRRQMPAIPIDGPDVGDNGWLHRLPQFLASEPRLHEFTFHRYGLSECVARPHSLSYPTVANLLSAFASRQLIHGVGPYVTIAHEHGVAFRIDETNSVTCGGKLGVSNSFASALWILDSLFGMARGRVDAVNVHVPHGYNEPFGVQHIGGRWSAEIRPEYYGLMMFAQATPPGAHLLRCSTVGDGVIRAWATLAPDGHIRLVLINHDRHRTVSVRVHTATPTSTATVERLRAPSAYSTGHVTLGGRSFASPTYTGRLSGALQTGRVSPHGNTYTVRMRPASAALLTFTDAPH